MKFQFRRLHWLMPLMLVFLLSACGFHLRGMNTIPRWLNHVAIISENNDKQFVSILESYLEGSRINIESDPSHAQYWLIINEVNLQQQIISIGSSTNPRQYTLTLTVLFKLKTRKDQDIEMPGKINISRQLTLNNDRILGSKDEESIIIGEMKQDAAIQIINRISHIRHSPRIQQGKIPQ